MGFTILQATNFPAGLRDKLDSSVEIIGPFGLPVGATLSVDQAATVRVLITMGTLVTNAAVMDRFPNLGIICCYGTGYEGVDIEAARKRGIMVTHSPAANASSVADLAMALLLAVSRRRRFVSVVPARRLTRGHSLRVLSSDWSQSRLIPRDSRSRAHERTPPRCAS
jgi:hydroxypyruvate reductase